MKHKKELIKAFEGAVPGFKAQIFVSDVPREDDVESICLWIEALLGETFCCHIEWHDFGDSGLHSVQDLQPIQHLGVDLCIDQLQDEQGQPVDPTDVYPGQEGPFYLPLLNLQLAPYELQLLELGKMFETARLLCVTTHEPALQRLLLALESVGVPVLD